MADKIIGTEETPFTGLRMHNNGDDTFSMQVYDTAAGGGGGGAVTVADGADITLGMQNDSAANSDTGTFSLIALVKRLLGKLPTLVSGRMPVDGSGVTQPVSAIVLPLPAGAATAAKQAALGTAGSASADVISVQGEAGMTPLAVGGQKTPTTYAFTRPADTTAYTAKDVVAPASLSVTAATNATPIVCTTATHGLVDGDVVTISGALGNTAANGTFYVKVTGQSSTTFALYSDKALSAGVAGNGAWTSGGTVLKLLRFAGAGRVNGGSGYVVKATILTDQTTCVETFRLHLFHTPPSAIADNAGCTAPLYADVSKYSGTIDFTAMSTEATGSTAAYSNMTPNTTSSKLPLAFVCNSLNTDLYGVLESVLGFTPASGQQVSIKITVEAD